jgi:hypothetical protein
MFIGAINTDLRAVLAELAPAWGGLPVYVGCSGNFTIERILAGCGLKVLHGNDVPIYSCALGALLSGTPFRVSVKDEKLAWLGEYLEPGVKTVATLLMCTSTLDFYDRGHPYHERMWNAYLRRWAQLHQETCAKIEMALDGVALSSYFAGDVFDFVKDAPAESVVISFPPTYKGGYERLYKRLAATFDWDEPKYVMFTPERFDGLVDEMKKKRVWVVSRDEPIPKLAGHEIAQVQTGLRSKPVWVYSNQRLCRVTTPRQKVEAVPYERLTGEPLKGPLQVLRLTQGQLNTLRSEYLSPSIVLASADICFGVCLGGKLFGAFAFANGGFGNWCDLYMMTDLAINAPVARLSKLVLTAVMSKEVLEVLEQKHTVKIRTIGTTAFTKRPNSMKYRMPGWELHSRKEGMLNYVGPAGKWTLAEGLEWWLKTQFKPGQVPAKSEE